jgi:hypothetical protein
MKYLVKPEHVVGKKVRVYRNLQRDCWSVLYQGRVIYHAKNLELKDVSFKVFQGGYERFLTEKRKNVHAFVCGEVVSVDFTYSTHGGTQVTYNPWVSNLFHTVKPLFKGRSWFFSEEESLHRAVFCGTKLFCFRIKGN